MELKAPDSGLWVGRLDIPKPAFCELSVPVGLEFLEGFTMLSLLGQLQLRVESLRLGLWVGGLPSP